MDKTTAPDRCLTCYGAGETPTESGIVACPDCFGSGRPLSGGAKLEWRLRQIVQTHRGTGSEHAADVLWLVHELRKSREALIRILTRCQDAEETDAFAMEIRYRANEALALYDPTQEEPPRDGR
jgi:hypothetical protein